MFMLESMAAVLRCSTERGGGEGKKEREWFDFLHERGKEIIMKNNAI